MRGWGMKKSFMERMAAFIVDKRRLFVVLFAVACVLSIFSVSKTDVNNELTDYLPDSTQTRQGLEIMNREFITYGDAKVMVSNVTFAQAEELAEMLRGVDGVKSVEFEKDTQHYNSASALFVVTFDGEKLDEISIQGVKNVRAALDGYDTYITTEIGNPTGEILEREMRIVLIILMCSIFVVLLLTSHTYAEVPVLIITFAVAVWVNKGTNYWFHEVSFITNSIAAVLQLGLGIDYAIIMCHHYTEERERMEPREATIRALTLAIPEISASSLTTISGLLALSFMKIKIGEDMSLVLIKAILFLMLTVFFLPIFRLSCREQEPIISSITKHPVKNRYDFIFNNLHLTIVYYRRRRAPLPGECMYKETKPDAMMQGRPPRNFTVPAVCRSSGKGGHRVRRGPGSLHPSACARSPRAARRPTATQGQGGIKSPSTTL